MTEVRVATADDQAAIATLRRTWTEENAGHPVDDPTFDQRFAAWFEREHDQRVTWLAYAGAEPVGMLNLLVFTRMPFPLDADTARPTRWGYLANCFVVAGVRNRGVGDALLVLTLEPRVEPLLERRVVDRVAGVLLGPGAPQPGDVARVVGGGDPDLGHQRSSGPTARSGGS